MACGDGSALPLTQPRLVLKVQTASTTSTLRMLMARYEISLVGFSGVTAIAVSMADILKDRETGIAALSLPKAGFSNTDVSRGIDHGTSICSLIRPGRAVIT